MIVVVWLIVCFVWLGGGGVGVVCLQTDKSRERRASGLTAVRWHGLAAGKTNAVER